VTPHFEYRYIRYFTIYKHNKDVWPKNYKCQSRLHKSKLRMYHTLVRPVVTYACETGVLKENIKTKLRVFERKALRRIYGPTKESDGTWRIKLNEELNRLIGNKNIINYIKAQRLAWFGHVHHMPDNSMVKKVYEWSPTLTRSLGRPKNRWEDDVKSDITNMHITNWRDCIRNWPKWKEFVEKAKISLKLWRLKKKKKKSRLHPKVWKLKKEIIRLQC